MSCLFNPYKKCKKCTSELGSQLYSLAKVANTVQPDNYIYKNVTFRKVHCRTLNLKCRGKDSPERNW